MLISKSAVAPPPYWATYLINGDRSGLEDTEIQQADAWAQRTGWGDPVDSEDYGFCRSHDALAEMPLAADCQTYTFLVDE